MTKIFFGQYIAGISVLEKGGNFVMKFYNFYEIFNISLVYLMSTHFNEIRLVKPESSRQFGGSENLFIMFRFSRR